MNTRSKIAMLALSALMSTSALAVVTPSFADTTTNPPAATTTPTAATPATATPAPKDAVAKVSEKANDDAIIKTVDEAYKAMREVQAARLAIFNGSTDQADKFVAEAKNNMRDAQTQAKDFAIKTQKPAADGDAYIPFDTSISLSEGFKPTAEKQASLDKANAHLAKGEHKEAVEVLKAANVDVTISAAMIPANASVSHINDAVNLISQKKYYEANLALKAVQDSVIIDAYSADGIPTQGAHS